MSLRLRNAAEYPALAQTQPLLGLAFFGVTLTHCWGGAVTGIFPSPGLPLLQRLRLHRLLELSLVMTVSGPGTPEPRPSDPGVRTDSFTASPLRSCAFAPGRRHLILALLGTRLGGTWLLSRPRCSAHRLSLHRPAQPSSCGRRATSCSNVGITRAP